MTKDEALKLALVALENAVRYHGIMLMADPPQAAWKYHRVEDNAKQAITAIKKALAQPPLPEQQPVACRFCHSKKGCYTWLCDSCGEIDDVQQPAVQPVQEPVAWGWRYDSCGHAVVNRLVATETSEPTLFLKDVFARGPFPLYAAPQPVQEPVGKVVEINNDGFKCEFSQRLAVGTKLYTAPPATQRPWVGLTEDEKFEMAAAQCGWEDLLIAAEALLKERNT